MVPKARLPLSERRLRQMYRHHSYNAENRNVEFLLTFEEWVDIWVQSGHLHERGRKRGQYVMARFGDKGAYEVGNVRICTVEENHKEMWDNPEYRTNMLKKLREASIGRVLSEEARGRIGTATSARLMGNTIWLGKTHSEETKEKFRAHKHSEETKLLMSESGKKGWEERKKRSTYKDEISEASKKSWAKWQQRPDYQEQVTERNKKVWENWKQRPEYKAEVAERNRKIWETRRAKKLNDSEDSN